MKNSKICIFALSMVSLLASCGLGGYKTITYITLNAPTNTCMLTDNCKAYIDAMRAQEQKLKNEGVDIYKYHDLYGEDGVKVEDYLDTGTVEAQNNTVTGKTPNRSDRNTGVELKFNVEQGSEKSEYKVLVSLTEDFKNAKEYVTETNAVTVYNLFVNTNYYWKVVTGREQSEVGTFKTADYPRWISNRPMFNIRDNGGYMTSSGKRVKQGLVYRGGEITNKSWGEHAKTNSAASKKVFREDMAMVGGVELDLRGASDIGDGYKACGFAEKDKNGKADIAYKQCAIKSYEQTFTNTRSTVKQIFEVLKDADTKHVYYHCYGGADRTGTIGFLLNGLLGVSYTDLVIDFELTSYSSINNEHIRSHIQGHQHQYDRWPALINQLKTDNTGGYVWNDEAALKDNIEQFLVKACSVPQDTVNTIKRIMIED